MPESEKKISAVTDTLVHYTCLLPRQNSEGVLITLDLPRDFNQRDLMRLTKFLQTLLVYD